MKKPLKKLPKFASEQHEARFWKTHDSAEYVDYSAARPASFPQLKPSTATISLRVPTSMLVQLKTLANKRDVPYQSLLKLFLAERMDAESRNMARSTS